jgi:putative flippase GtrA
LKFQTAAIIATGIDFTVYYSIDHGLDLSDFFEKPYVIAAIFSAISGAIVNFTILKYWAADTSQKKLIHQVGKYIIVSAGSLLLNVALIYLITEFFHISSDISKIASAIIVAISYNFILQKYFVFKA